LEAAREAAVAALVSTKPPPASSTSEEETGCAFEELLLLASPKPWSKSVNSSGRQASSPPLEIGRAVLWETLPIVGGDRCNEKLHARESEALLFARPASGNVAIDGGK
jgi:hypothetical protein